MTVNIMAGLAGVYALMTYLAYLDGNAWGVGGMGFMTLCCAWLAWENRLQVIPKKEWSK